MGGRALMKIISQKCRGFLHLSRKKISQTPPPPAIFCDKIGTPPPPPPFDRAIFERSLKTKKQ